MAYSRVNWQDGQAGGTPLSAANLNIMDEGIKNAHDRLDAATPSATANTLMSRDANGRSKVSSPVASDDIATKGYVDGLVGPLQTLQAGTAFAYYLTPPNVELSSNNTVYDFWWIRDETRNVVAVILLPGTIRYHVQYRARSSNDTAYVRILLNGSQIREVSTSSTSWQTVTGNITVSPGDLVAIQKRVTVEGLAFWQNVRLETAQPALGIQRF